MDAQRPLSPADSEYLDSLEKQDLKRISKELLRYAEGLAVSEKLWVGSRRSFTHLKRPMLADGFTPSDLVQHVLFKTVEGIGDWKWDFTRNDDIRVHLKLRIWSVISTLIEKDDNTKRIPVPKDEDGAERFDWLEGRRETNKSRADDVSDDPSEDDCSTDVLAQLTANHQAEHPGNGGLIAILENQVQDDPRLLDVLAYLANGTPARRIADAMGISVEEIYNLTKRLKRRLRQFLQPETPNRREANA